MSGQGISHALKGVSLIRVLRSHAARWRACKYALILSDIFVIYVFYYFWRGVDVLAPVNFSPSLYSPLMQYSPVIDLDYFFIPACVFTGLSFFYGCYSKRRLIWDDVRRVCNFAAVACLVDIVILEFLDIPHSVFAILLQWGFLIIAVSVGRQGTKYALRTLGIWQIPTRILGCGENAYQAYLTFKKEPALGYQVDAFVRISDEAASESCLAQGIPVVEHEPAGDMEESFLLGTSVFSDRRVVIAAEKMLDESVLPILNVLTACGQEVDIVPPVRGLPLLGMEVSHVFGREAVILHTKDALARPLMRAFKLVFDLVVALLVLVLFLPVLLVIAAYIKLEDGGPIFFTQTRIGYRGKPFKCLKFRTMRVDAEERLAEWQREEDPLWQSYVDSNFKIKDDPRVTRVGRFLRSTSLDELPQVINVLKGEMSLVGPRPMLPREAEPDWARHVHYRRVRPGITGMWQISGRSNTSFLDRISYDEWYSKNWSVWHDIIIILKTVLVLLRRDGAY